jgi:glycogen debranching enzyme
LTTEPQRDAGAYRFLKHDRLQLISDPTGSVTPDERGHGLYAGDTRFGARIELTIDGVPVVLADDPGEDGSAVATTLGNPSDGDRIQLRAAGIPGLRVERDRILAAGLTESLRLVAAGRPAGRLAVRLVVGFDAADIFEIRGYPRSSRGELLPAERSGAGLRFGYLGLDSRLRTLELIVDSPPPQEISIGSSADGREVTAAFDWQLAPATGSLPSLTWRLLPHELPVADRAAALRAMRRPPALAPTPRRPGSSWTGSDLESQAGSQVEIEVDDPALQLVLDRALADLRLLTEAGPGEDERFIVAGVPWFAALFGRDSLLTAYEAIAFRPDLAVDLLTTLANHQARAGDRHGGEAGQILHELRTGEMARLDEVPFGPSFASVDATPLWLVLLGELGDWTGDRAVVDALWPAAVRALDWLDRRAAVARDGFIRYTGRPGALANEGWKDSPDAIRDRTGAIVPAPIALAEVQGYAYDALRRMAGLARSRGEGALANRLNRRARDLRSAFHDAFWTADRQFPPIAIGRDGRAADAIASNGGQCLWSGIVDPARTAAIAERLLTSEMDSGWGIRTLASDEPAFDPSGYHTGSVWPHDTALIVGGLKSSGFDRAALDLADRLLEAAAALPNQRLPELFSGAERRPAGPPALLPNACVVQAWASAAPLHLVRTLLGLRPMARSGRLVLDRPRLPSRVGRLALRGVAVGPRRVDLEVTRTRAGFRARSTSRAGRIEVVSSG